MKRYIFRLLLLLAILLVVVAGLIFFLISSESGLSLMVSQLNRWQPAGLSVGSASGRVLGPLSIRGFKREAVDGVVSIESFDLDWQSPAPWRPTLLISTAKIQGVRVSLTSQEPKTIEEPTSDSIVLPDSLNLPIDILVNDFVVNDIKIKSGGNAEELVFDSIKASIRATREDDAEISLAVESDLLELNADLDAITRERYELSGKVNWRLSLPELAVVRGQMGVVGDLDQLTITPSLEAPYGADFKAVVSEPLDNLVIDLSGSITSSDLSNIKSDLPPYSVAADISFNGSPEQGAAASVVTVKGLLPDVVKINLKSKINQKLILIDALEFRVANQMFTLDTNGSVDLSGTQPDIDIVGQWSNLQWPFDDKPIMTSKAGVIKAKGPIDKIVASIKTELGENGRLEGDAKLNGDKVSLDVSWGGIAWPLDGSQLRSADGTFQIDGTKDDYSLSLRTKNDFASAGTVIIEATGDGSDKHLNLPLKGSALSGEFIGQAEVNLDPVLAFTLALDGSDFDPSVLSAQLPGDLSIALRVAGETINDELAISLNTFNVDGTLRELPLVVRAVARTKGSEIAIETVSINSGPTTVLLNGVVNENIELEWMIDSPDLSTLYKDAKGRIKSDGKLRGALPLPSIQATIDAADLSLDGMSVNAVKAQASIDPNANGDIDFSLSVNDAVAPGIEISSFSTLATGRVDEHNIALELRSNQGNIDLGINAQLKQPLWNYTVNALELAPVGLGAWALVKPASGSVNAGAIRLDALCLRADSAELCSNVQRDKNLLLASYKLNNFPLSYVSSFVPEGTFVEGSISSEGEWAAPVGKSPTAQLNTTLNSINIEVLNPDADRVTIVTMRPSSINAKLDATGVASTAKFDLGELGILNGNFTSKGSLDTLATAEISGGLEGEIKDFDFVADLVPDIEAISGRLKSDIQFRGTPSRPIVSGGLDFNQGSLQLGTPGLELKNIQATLKAKSVSVLDLRAVASSGKGNLEIDGTVDLADDNPEFSVAINGRDFEVLNTPDARAAISPSLDVLIRQDRVYFNGDVDVPLLQITPKKIPSNVVLANEDQVIVSEEAKEATGTPIPVKGTVNVSLGNDVSIDAFGLEAKLSGKIRVTEAPGSETTASGRLAINEGLFRAYGQKLQVQNGQILFAGGPISQPGFDIEAVRKVTTELQVGVRVRGVATSPQFSLFSTPSMSESEQMSYLVLGRSIQENSPSENSAVSQAAMALGVAGGKALTEKFGSKLGVDSISIDSELRETGEQASLTVGKYLSPKLFVSYGVGLFEPVSTLRLNYTVRRNIKIISETTETRSGGDIVFTFESAQ